MKVVAGDMNSRYFSIVSTLFFFFFFFFNSVPKQHSTAYTPFNSTTFSIINKIYKSDVK